MFETQGGHAESNPRPSEEGVSFYHVLRPLDHMCDSTPTENARCREATGAHAELIHSKRVSHMACIDIVYRPTIDVVRQYLGIGLGIGFTQRAHGPIAIHLHNMCPLPSDNPNPSVRARGRLVNSSIDKP